MINSAAEKSERACLKCPDIQHTAIIEPGVKFDTRDDASSGKCRAVEVLALDDDMHDVCGTYRRRGESKLLKLIESPTKANGDAVIELKVYRKPSRPNEIVGLPMLSDPRPTSQVGAVYYGQGLPIAESFREVSRLAHSKKVELLYIVDPSKLLDAPECPDVEIPGT